jgi:hypothetical protein
LGAYYYPLDDAYIHLAISKNISEHGVWGITQYEFSNTSSSPLFTILLAMGIKIFGNFSLLSLYFNIITSNILLLLLYRFFKEKPFQLLLVYIGFMYGVLLKIQVLSGMEHCMQLLIISCLWLSFYKWFNSEFLDKKSYYLFITSVFLSCVIRYESIFLITSISLLLLCFKQVKHAIFTPIIALIPMVIFGIYSIQQGGYFFPNSLLVKGKHSFNFSQLIDYFVLARDYIYENFYFPFILLLIFMVFIAAKSSIKPIKINFWGLLCPLILTIIWHLMFAHKGWLYRYDAYLIALLVLSLGNVFSLGVFRSKIHSVVFIVLIFFTSQALFDRVKESRQTMKYASKNIFDQQIQMSKFISTFFNKSTVVANDIGAIAYFSQIKLHDLVGLGSTDILKIKLNHKNLDSHVSMLSYDLMIIYDEWYKNNHFDNRIKVAELSITNNKICGHRTVSFYISTKFKDKSYLLQSLDKFKKSLPNDVEFNIYKL